MIRIGFWGPLYYTYGKEPLKKVTKSSLPRFSPPAAAISSGSGPVGAVRSQGCQDL